MSVPRLSYHARKRAGEMGISLKQVETVLRNPDLTYPANQHKYPDCYVAVKGDLAVPFHLANGDPVARTVLWNRKEGREAS